MHKATLSFLLNHSTLINFQLFLHFLTQHFLIDLIRNIHPLKFFIQHVPIDMICNVELTQFFDKECHLLILTVRSASFDSVTVRRRQFLKSGGVIIEGFVDFPFLVGMDRTRW